MGSRISVFSCCQGEAGNHWYVDNSEEDCKGVSCPQNTLLKPRKLLLKPLDENQFTENGGEKLKPHHEKIIPKTRTENIPQDEGPGFSNKSTTVGVEGRWVLQNNNHKKGGSHWDPDSNRPTDRHLFKIN